MKYSIVIPCYKTGEKSINTIVELLIQEFKDKTDSFEMVLVNDCSPDGGNTWKIIKGLSEKYSFVKSINLSMNVGQHNAIMAALRYTDGDRILALDDDMQTHPSEMWKLVDKMEEGYEIVYGYYPDKKENVFRKIGSGLHFLTVRMLIGKPKWLKSSSYWLITKQIKNYVIEYTHPNVHLQGIFLRTTRNIACVPVKHYERQEGKSTYTLKKLIKLYFNVIGFSEVPLKFMVSCGFSFAILGLIGMFIILIRRLIGIDIALGWSSTMVALCFFSGIMLCSIGIVGIYIGRIFQSVTRSPQYVIRETCNINEDDK